MEEVARANYALALFQVTLAEMPQPVHAAMYRLIVAEQEAHPVRA